jgi:hypothetical protein
VESADQTPPRNSSLNIFKTLVVYFMLLAAVVQLCIFHLLPDAPVWQNRSTNSQQLSLERGLAAVDQQFLDEATGGNMVLHFQGFDASDFHQSLAMSQFYFRANYTLYPHRAFIGHADRTLNEPAAMVAADVVPDLNWLRQHDVHAVRTIIRISDNVFSENLQTIN